MIFYLDFSYLKVFHIENVPEMSTDMGLEGGYKESTVMVGLAVKQTTMLSALKVKLKDLG